MLKCLLPTFRILILFVCLLGTQGAFSSPVISGIPIRWPTPDDCRKLIAELEPAKLLDLRYEVLAGNIHEAITHLEAALIYFDGARILADVEPLNGHGAFLESLKPELVRLVNLFEPGKYKFDPNKPLDPALANRMLNLAIRKLARFENPTIERLNRTLVHALNLNEFFLQTQRKRLLLVVGDEVSTVPLLSLPYERWQMKMAKFAGSLDQTEKKLKRHELDAATQLLLDAIDLKAKAEEPSKRNADVEVTGGEPRSVLHEKIEKFELKTLEPGATSNTVLSRVQDSLKNGGQSAYILIDARNSGLSYEQAVHGAERIAGTLKTRPRYQDRLRELSIIGEDYHLTVTFMGQKEYDKRNSDSEQHMQFQEMMWDHMDPINKLLGQHTQERNKLLFVETRQLWEPSRIEGERTVDWIARGLRVRKWTPERLGFVTLGSDERARLRDRMNGQPSKEIKLSQRAQAAIKDEFARHPDIARYPEYWVGRVIPPETHKQWLERELKLRGWKPEDVYAKGHMYFKRKPVRHIQQVLNDESNSVPVDLQRDIETTFRTYMVPTTPIRRIPRNR